MVLNIAAALAAGLILLYAVATIVQLVGYGGVATLFAQTTVSSLAAYALFSVGFIGLNAAVALALLPVVLRLFVYGWLYWQGLKILNGDYGDQARWSAELVQEDGTEFVEAMSELSRSEFREIGIIAESKEELREETLQRANGSDE